MFYSKWPLQCLWYFWNFPNELKALEGQFKKPFQGLGQDEGAAVWNKREKYFPDGTSLICPPGKSMIFNLSWPLRFDCLRPPECMNRICNIFSCLLLCLLLVKFGFYHAQNRVVIYPYKCDVAKYRRVSFKLSICFRQVVIVCGLELQSSWRLITHLLDYIV